MSETLTEPRPGGHPGALAAVLFDMDGTLVDTEVHWDVALEELAQRLGDTLSAPARAEITGSSVPTALGILYRDVGVTRGAGQQAADDAWLQARVAELMQTSVPWRPGAPELLRAVRDSGLRTALVTTTFRAIADIALGHIGRHFFDVTVCGDEVPATKPSPAPYLQAMDALGVAAAACVVIEDSVTGVTAGLAAGAAVLGVPSLSPFTPAPGLTVRGSLTGVRVADLQAVLAARPVADVPG
ncbi:HAD family hydrolase [Goekera deserti]|nr:HAD family phosphatase [Goekera deserti]